jgi:predicted enzyme related to lactoylglutathione lyase
MNAEVLFAGVAVADYARAVPFYERLFGRPADVVVHDHEVMWRVTDGAWLYVVGDAERAGRALVAICVPDLDEALGDLAARGITPGPVEVVGDSNRKATVTDLEANAISFIEVPGPRR